MTQPGSLSWNVLLGEVIGALVVIGAFVGHFKIKKHREEARRERPPQREKVLRPAGYSANRRIDDLAERRLLALAYTIGAAAMLGIMCVGFFPLVEGLVAGRFTFAQVRGAASWHLLWPGVGMTALALLGMIWCFRRTAQLEDELRNWRFGLRGEQAVAEKLMTPELAKAGYITFHDVPGDGAWNIDHVVVGPGGVFVLETKTRPRRKATRQQPEEKVLFDGVRLQFPWCDDPKATRQAERNARWVRKFIADFAPKDMLVQPVVVIPGWYVESLGNYSVKAMNAMYLVGYLIGSKRRFREEQLRPIIRRFDERCRDLEF
jgi:Nuclease-related domain